MLRRRLTGWLLVLSGVTVVVLLVTSLVIGPLGSRLAANANLPTWLIATQPKIELPPDVVCSIFGWPVTNTMISAWLATLLIGAISFVATRKMKIIPSGLQNALEYIIEWLLNLCQGVAGKENGRKFFPVVAAIFLFIVVNAWISQFPFFLFSFLHRARR